MEKLSNKIKTISYNNNSTIDFQKKHVTDGNLALNLNEENVEYSKPVVKKLVRIKPAKKTFMGCWQGCNEDNEGDGC